MLHTFAISSVQANWDHTARTAAFLHDQPYKHSHQQSKVSQDPPHLLPGHPPCPTSTGSWGLIGWKQGLIWGQTESRALPCLWLPVSPSKQCGSAIPPSKEGLGKASTGRAFLVLQVCCPQSMPTLHHVCGCRVMKPTNHRAGNERARSKRSLICPTSSRLDAIEDGPSS